MSRQRIGLAVGERGVTLVARVREVWHRADEPLAPAAHEDAAALGSALRAATERLTVLGGESLDGARVHVALLPPLADARLVRLPPLRTVEAEAVLRRDATRYFPGGTAARIVAVAHGPARRSSEDGDPGTFAAAAPLATVEAVRSAVAAAGWRLDGIVPAQAAWLAALPEARGEQSADVVVAVHDDAAYVSRREAGGVTTVRRIPATWHDEIVAAAGTAEGTALLLADRVAREPLSRALRAAGWNVAEADPADAAAAAAAFAAAPRLRLVSPLEAAAMRDRQRRLGAWAAAAAVVLVVAAAAVELWGTQRELAAVRARRAELRDEVTPLLVVRDSLSRLEARVEMLRDLAEASPRWTRALFDMAMLLPPDARITRFSTEGDTLYVEAAGARAGAALQALRSASSIRDVRMDGAVLRDLEGGETVVERFRVRALLDRTGAWSPPATRPVADDRERASPADADDDEEESNTPPPIRRSM